MTITYPSVSIGSQPYDVYADIEQADLYLDASIATSGTLWRAAVTDLKSRALVSATRWLDSVSWQGDKTDADQALAWPRMNITDVESDTLPSQLGSACIELAATLVEDNEARAVLNEPLIKEMSAGRGTFLTYFRPENVQVLTPFPSQVMAYISQWLTALATVSGVDSFGVSAKSKLSRNKYDFSHGL